MRKVKFIMTSFAFKLAQHKKTLGYTQVKLAVALGGVPHRTLQSWLQGEKEPPNYVQELVLQKLDSLELDKGISKQ